MKTIILKTILAVFLLSGITVHTACATSKNEFLIQGVEVVVDKPSSPSRLRDMAIDQGVKEAFAILLKNITPRETWSRHESILEISNYDSVLEKFIIVKEEIKPVYKVVLDIHFNDVAVKKMLADLNVPFSEATGGKVLIIPLLELENETYLWQMDNPWKKALENRSGYATYFQFVLPTGDAKEMQLLTPEMARFGAGDILMELAKSYGASGAVVSKASVKNYFDGRYLEVENLWYGRENYDTAVSRVTFPENAPFEEVLYQASLKAMEDMAEHWRGSSLIQVDRPGRVFLRYHPDGPADLERLKKRILELTVVKDFSLRVLNVEDSIFQVDFYGDKDQMRTKLRSIGLDVQPTHMNMVWKVAFAGQGEGMEPAPVPEQVQGQY